MRSLIIYRLNYSSADEVWQSNSTCCKYTVKVAAPHKDKHPLSPKMHSHSSEVRQLHILPSDSIGNRKGKNVFFPFLSKGSYS